MEVCSVQLEDELGDILGKARLGLGLTLGQVAATTGLSQSEVADTEACRLVPDGDRLTALANALSLDAGKLAAIVSGWTPAPIALTSDKLIVDSLAVSYSGYVENCYLIACAETHAAAVIDPGGATSEIVARLTNNLKLEMVLVTHAHGDHIGGLKQLLAGRPKTQIVNHQLERDSVTRGLPNPWTPAMDGVPVKLGNLSITPLFTPGHTPGSTCYHVDELCFVGDTLFAGSIGRPASPAAYHPMLTAIRSKLLALQDSTVLLPGHGPATTVKEEKARNPFL